MARTKEFDTDLAIEQAMQVFWSKGFQATSLSDLTSATGLHKGSLYGAFKSKENLFKLALEKYGENTRKNFISTECPLDYAKNFFKRLVTEGATGKASKGCMILNANLEFGASTCKLGSFSKDLFGQIEKNFAYVIELAQKQGKLPKETKKSEAISRIMGAIFAIRELSKFKNDKTLLKDIANGALKELGLSI